MKIETKKLLFDVMSACQSIERFTTGQTFEHYGKTRSCIRPCSARAEIVGDALVRMRAADRVVFGRIPDSTGAVGAPFDMRHAAT